MKRSRSKTGPSASGSQLVRGGWEGWMYKSQRSFASVQTRGVRQSCPPRHPRLPISQFPIGNCGKSVRRRYSIRERDCGRKGGAEAGIRLSGIIGLESLRHSPCARVKPCRNRTRRGGSRETEVMSAWRYAFQVTSTKTHRPWT